MGKQGGIVEIHGRKYKTVALRVSEFRKEHPNLGLVTEILEMDAERVVMLAKVLSDPGELGLGRVLATGHAEEQRASSQINRTSALENCETSAIGRALACFGFGGSEFASADELANAITQQSKPSQRKTSRPTQGKQEHTKKAQAEKVREILTKEIGAKSAAEAGAVIGYATDGVLGVEHIDSHAHAVLGAIQTAWEGRGNSYEGYLEAATERAAIQEEGGERI